MEKIKKSSNTAVKIAKALRTLSIIGLVFSVLGAICGFAMNGFINQYYQDPGNLAAAQGSLEADMAGPSCHSRSSSGDLSDDVCG